MFKVFYDAEFTGLHRNSTLISLGMVTENDYTFYAEFTDYDHHQCNDWIKENVIDNLLFKDQKYFTKTDPMSGSEGGGMPRYSVQMKDNKRAVAKQLYMWLLNIHVLHHRNEKIEIVTDCYAYDWMLLVDLLLEEVSECGSPKTAIDMPGWIYYIPMDLSTLLYAAGVDPDINREEFANATCVEFGDIPTKVFSTTVGYDDMSRFKHNALWDAYVIQKCWNKIQRHIIPDKASLLMY